MKLATPIAALLTVGVRLAAAVSQIPVPKITNFVVSKEGSGDHAMTEVNFNVTLGDLAGECSQLSPEFSDSDYTNDCTSKPKEGDEDFDGAWWR